MTWRCPHLAGLGDKVQDARLESAGDEQASKSAVARVRRAGQLGSIRLRKGFFHLVLISTIQESISRDARGLSGLMLSDDGDMIGLRLRSPAGPTSCVGKV
jgi:hypothetical protein